MAQQRHAPGVRITVLPSEKAVSGEPLELGNRLQSFVYEDDEKKADKVTITVDNYDLSFFDRTDLVGGCILEVSWGYPGNMAVPRRVVIQKIKGFQALTFEGVSTGALMAKQTKTRAWKGKTRAQVVKEVLREWGYSDATLFVDETDIVYDVINQSAETDAALLRRLATKEGFKFYFDTTGAHWEQRKSDEAPIRVFTWQADGTGTLQTVSFESDLARRAGRVDVKARDPLKKSTLDTSSDASTADRTTLGDVVEVVDPKTGKTALQRRMATSVTRPSDATTEAEAKQEAEARFRKAEENAVKMTVTLVGDPQLAAKSVVELRGISKYLSGKYNLRSVKHTVTSGGFTCEAKVQKDSVGRRSGLETGKRDDGQRQGGSRNDQSAIEGGALKPVEKVDPVTGRTSVRYVRGKGQQLGAGDPEAR